MLIDELITPQHCKGFIFNQMSCREHRCSVSVWPFLAYINEICHVRNAPYFFELFDFSSLLQMLFEFERMIEMIFNTSFVPSGDNDNVFYAGGNCFLNNILNDRFVEDWMHFFGLGFGCW